VQTEVSKWLVRQKAVSRLVSKEKVIEMCKERDKSEDVLKYIHSKYIPRLENGLGRKS
jgi:hypothetical protein